MFYIDDLWQPDKPLPSKPVLQAIAIRCAEAWQCPQLLENLHIGYNGRLKTTAGLAYLETGRVQLNTRLLSSNPDQLIPTLIHELAHIAVHRRFGPSAKPHGREFLTLMRAVNLSPKATHTMKMNNDH